MVLQLSAAVRNARLDAIETIIGASPILEIRSGPKPVNCDAADSGTVLATLNLPSDWLAPANLGTNAKSGTWQDPSADATGVAGHFRIKDSGGIICHLQGSITETGDGGDMEVDNVDLTIGQLFTVTAFGFTEGNP